MVNFFRLIFFFFVIVSANSAFAAFTAPLIYTVYGKGGIPYTGNSPAAACSSGGPQIPPSAFTVTYTSVTSNGANCEVGTKENGSYNGVITSAPVCPSNSVKTGLQCSCVADFQEQGAFCIPVLPPGQCIANSFKNDAGECVCKSGYKQELGTCMFDHKSACDTWELLGSTIGGDLTGADVAVQGRVDDGAVFCNPVGWAGAPSDAGCRISFEQQMVAGNRDGSTTSYGKWNASPKPGSTDLSCTAGDGTTEGEQPKKPDAPKCNNGSPGTVNGVEVCVPRQPNNGVETGGKETTTTDDGTNTTKKENNSTTVCKDGKCTTTTVTNTTVTNNASGNAITSSTTNSTTTSQGDFCAKNPKDAQCNGTGTGSGSGKGDGDGDKEPSKFGGACASGFTCEGDAIQCAMAREQHTRNCKLYGPDDDPGSVTNKALSGSDEFNMATLKSEAQQVAVGTFDQAGLGWSHSCPADPEIPLNFGGRSASFSIPFSRICGPLGILSLAGVGLTLLGSMVWVLGGRNNRG